KSFMIYQDTWEKDFYPNGGIKRDKSTVKHIERIKAYYPGGQLKTIQTKTYRDEYYDNGSKKITYRWKKKRDDRRSGAFIITKTEYDETGAAAGRMVYEYWYSDPIAQPRMSIQQSDWIDSFEKFEAGKKVLSVEDMDTKDFLKKYPDDTDEE
ncbi:MAG TPA: hypothetical protein VHB54_10005, partial [Mucilaginibacter sp.]|nr:hypothetical protein [Mucilaginibacter sp.]